MNKINLQLFADAGTMVNATDGYVNAYTGEREGFSGKNSLSSLMKTFYDTELLENARAELYHTQFGKKQGLPRNKGKIMEWRKWNTLPNAPELTEGVIPTGQKFGQSSMTSEIASYGMYVPVTDQLELHAVDDVILGATEELGASAGSTEDVLVRNVIVGGTNVLYANDGGTEVTARYGLSEGCRLTADLVNRAATTLKKLNAPKINGKYVAIIHPSVAYDLRSDPNWIDAHKYAAVTEIFNGEIGELHNCRFVESTNAKIFCGEDLASDSRNLAVNGAVSSASVTIPFDGGTVEAGALVGRMVLIGDKRVKVTANTTNSLTVDEAITATDNAVIYPGEGGAEGCAVYATLFLGRDAYGIVDPDGAGLEMIVHDKSEVGGPLDQFSTVGYKLSTAAKILYEDRMVRVESGSTYSGMDAAN